MNDLLLRRTDSYELKKMIARFYPMSTEQILDLSERQFEFGGHTHTHTILSSLEAEESMREIEINKEKIESITGKPSLFFAYPNGDSQDFSQIHECQLKEVGFRLAFSLTQERNNLFNNRMAISRINAVPEDTSASLLFRCTGVTPFVDYWKGRIDRWGG
jgi:peptidoglycan/xylan/chitin deacetylase (PgdA/CDA1 family)